MRNINVYLLYVRMLTRVLIVLRANASRISGLEENGDPFDERHGGPVESTVGHEINNNLYIYRNAWTLLYFLVLLLDVHQHKIKILAQDRHI